jgi:glycosyltransferase involved in cell wall biosynthesis
MKVILLSIDPATKKEGSPAFARMREYEKLFEEFHVIVATSAQGLVRAYRKAAHIIKKDPMHFVVTTQEEMTGIVGLSLKRRYGTCWRPEIHTDLFNPQYKKFSFKNRIRVFVAKRILPYADSVRVVGLRMKKDIERLGITKAPVIVLTIFVDMSIFANIEKKADRNVFEILMVGRLAPEKNIALAIRAFKKLVGKKNAILRIVGEGSLRKELEALRAQLGIASNVIFEGESENREKVASYLARADCFLLTSWYEGYGMAVVEAMAAGLPVVMTDVGIAGSILEDGVSGLIVPPGDEEAVSRALAGIIGEKEMASTLGENAKKAVASMPTKEEYLRLFQESLTCKN